MVQRAIMRMLAGAALLLMSLSSARSAPSSSSYRVIVHPSNPTVKVDKAFLARAFLKKVADWPDGQVIRPVDLPQDSSTRSVFADDVLNRSVSAVKAYWQQMIFSGRRLPPPELASDEAVIRYVMMHPGAVGYVSARADIGETKIVQVE